MHVLKNKKILLITFILIGIISITGTVCILSEPNDIAYINRIPISKREFELLLKNNKTKVISELQFRSVYKELHADRETGC